MLNQKLYFNILKSIKVQFKLIKYCKDKKTFRLKQNLWTIDYKQNFCFEVFKKSLFNVCKNKV